jgi:hypothetical protein
MYINPQLTQKKVYILKSDLERLDTVFIQHFKEHP